MNQSLSDIGAACGTDKGTIHSYLDHYEMLLGDRRGSPLKILEFGIENGASLKMWAEFFPKAEVHGVDLVLDNVSEEVRKNPRISLHLLNTLSKSTMGFHDSQFDVIIDDGSHVPEDQIITFHYFWRCLKPGGMYFIEDVSEPRFCEYWTLPQFNFLKFLKDGRGDDIIVSVRKPL